jgi:hypothetical protein
MVRINWSLVVPGSRRVSLRCLPQTSLCYIGFHALALRAVAAIDVGDFQILDVRFEAYRQSASSGPIVFDTIDEESYKERHGPWWLSPSCALFE